MLGVPEGVLSPVVWWQQTLTDYGVVRRGFLCVPRYNVRRLAVQVHQGPRGVCRYRLIIDTAAFSSKGHAGVVFGFPTTPSAVLESPPSSLQLATGSL